MSDGEGGCPTRAASVCLTRSTSASKAVPPHRGSESYPDGTQRCGRGLARSSAHAPGQALRRRGRAGDGSGPGSDLTALVQTPEVTYPSEAVSAGVGAAAWGCGRASRPGAQEAGARPCERSRCARRRRAGSPRRRAGALGLRRRWRGSRMEARARVCKRWRRPF